MWIRIASNTAFRKSIRQPFCLFLQALAATLDMSSITIVACLTSQRAGGFLKQGRRWQESSLHAASAVGFPSAGKSYRNSPSRTKPTVERAATQWPEMSFMVNGELRQAYSEGLEGRFGALGLVLNIITLWNIYLGLVGAKLQNATSDFFELDLSKNYSLVKWLP